MKIIILFKYTSRIWGMHGTNLTARQGGCCILVASKKTCYVLEIQEKNWGERSSSTSPPDPGQEMRNDVGIDAAYALVQGHKPVMVTVALRFPSHTGLWIPP